MARILVIEDNPANLELMTYLIGAFGHAALAAVDGEAGLEVALREQPDLIVCDIQLPNLDGYQVLQRLKTYPALRNVPVVAVTALAMVGDRDKVLAAGFHGYISKPIDPETFISQLQAFLPDDQRVSTESRPSPTASAATQKSAGIPVTLLFVDDEPVNLELARSLFEPFGYRVMTARSAEEGLALARRAPPDLIASDLHMPGENGIDLIQRVKADPGLRPVPFVFLSSTMARSGPKERQALALGAVKVLRRPISAEALLDEIEKCLVKGG